METRLTGVFTALVTPFDDDGSFDEGVMRKLVERQVKGGVSGLVPCGTTGEAAAMTPDEHECVVRTVVDQAAGRVPVIAGAGANNTRRAIELSRRCENAGADALLHVTPYYVKPTQAGLIDHYRAVADAVELPVLLYNVPGRTGVTIAPKTALALAADPRFVGMKQAMADLDPLCEIVQGRPERFAIFSGEDSLVLPMMALGADGVISVTANEAPSQVSALVAAVQSGNWNDARRLHHKLWSLMKANFVETNPIPVKYALSRLGLIPNVLRSPMTPLSGRNMKTVVAGLERAGVLNSTSAVPPVAGAREDAITVTA